MAKRKGKGKAGRRIKHWHARYQAGEEADALGHRGRKHLVRGVKLPPHRLETPDENLDELPKKEGLVVAVYRRGTLVRIEGEERLCALAKTYRAPEGTSALAVGDVVTVAITQEHHVDGQLEIDKDRTQGMIVSRRPRETALARPRPTSARRIDPHQGETFEQVIAANMDLLLIVASIRQPKLRPRLVERFLIVAERGEMQPVLAINKIDLETPPAALIDGFRELGLEVVCCSAVRGDGLDALRRRLAGHKSVLAGASGVGKSALVNALIPHADAATRAIRMKDKRGRHTTAAASIYDLPVLSEADGPAAESSDGLVGVGPGGILVDTAGVRELGLALDLEELPWYFPEFERFSPHCRFNDCTHTHEPDCAVQAAVEDGEIPLRRFESYLRIRESLEE